MPHTTRTLLLGAALALAGTLTGQALAVSTPFELNWTPNAESDLAGYRIYSGSTPGQYGDPLAQVGLVTRYNGTLQHDTTVTKYFVLTALDRTGNESPRSNEVTKTFLVQLIPPVAPLLPGPTGVTFTNGLFSWVPNPSATATKLYVHKAGTPYDCTTQTFCGPVTGTSRQVTMEWSTQYDCWLASVNADGQAGDALGVACSTGAAPTPVPEPTPVPREIFGGITHAAGMLKFRYLPVDCPNGISKATGAVNKQDGTRTVTMTCLK